MFRICLVLLISFISFSFGPSAPKNVDEKIYDLPGMIKYFTLDAADIATIQSWSVATESTSPVKWIDKGPQWNEASSAYIKSGTTVIQVDGLPVVFNVVLIGTKIVVNSVQLNLVKSASVPVFQIEKMLNNSGVSTGFIKCENPMPKAYGNLSYSISVPYKKEAFVAYVWQCLKGECSANINIFYDRSKVDELKCY